MKFLIPLLSLFLLSSCASTKKKPEPPKKIEKCVVKKCLSLPNLSQKQEILFTALQSYLKELQLLHIDNIVEMTYPKLFRIIPKFQYKRQIQTMAKSSNLEIKSFESNITNIGKIKSFSDGNFSKVGYSSKIKIHLKNPKLYNTKVSIDTLYSIFVRKYGKENIHIDTKKRIISIKNKETMFAIKEADNQWKFLLDNPTYRELYPDFLPHEILDTI